MFVLQGDYSAGLLACALCQVPPMRVSEYAGCLFRMLMESKVRKQQVNSTGVWCQKDASHS